MTTRRDSRTSVTAWQELRLAGVLSGNPLQNFIYIAHRQVCSSQSIFLMGIVADCRADFNCFCNKFFRNCKKRRIARKNSRNAAIFCGICNVGICQIRGRMSFRMVSTSASISDWVVSRLRETRNAESMACSGTFMAVSTWLLWPLAQAEPAET